MYKKYYKTAKADYKKLKALTAPQKKQVTKIANKVVNRRSETKHHNAVQNYTAFGAVYPPVPVDLTLIPQGILDIERVGDRCTLVRMVLRLLVERPASAGSVSSTQRVLVFMWKPNTVPVASDILNIGPTGLIDINSDYNHDTRQEYKILMDKPIVQTIISNTQRYNKYLKFKLKSVPKDLQYVNASTVGTNHIYIMYITDASAVSYPNINYHSRIYFRDL